MGYGKVGGRLTVTTSSSVTWTSLHGVRRVSVAEVGELMAEHGMFEPVHGYLKRELGG